MVTLGRKLGRVALDLVFPPRCALCDAGGTLLCAPCAAGLPRASGERCSRCWMPSRRATVCPHCATDPPAFSSLRAAFIMDGGARRLTHELKYEGLTSLAEPMASLMTEAADIAGIDLIVPVPLHRGRQRRRGYNQAHELARHLSTALNLSADERCVRRVRDTAPLVKAMNREERRRTVAAAFAAEPSRVEGRSILLIDDVVTTGATLDACARALRDAGASDVRCLTWSRAD